MAYKWGLLQYLLTDWVILQAGTIFHCSTDRGWFADFHVPPRPNPLAPQQLSACFSLRFFFEEEQLHHLADWSEQKMISGKTCFFSRMDPRFLIVQWYLLILSLRIIGPFYRCVWLCIAGFWDLQTTSFEISWFLGWLKEEDFAI